MKGILEFFTHKGLLMSINASSRYTSTHTTQSHNAIAMLPTLLLNFLVLLGL